MDSEIRLTAAFNHYIFNSTLLQEDSDIEIHYEHLREIANCIRIKIGLSNGINISSYYHVDELTNYLNHSVHYLSIKKLIPIYEILTILNVLKFPIYIKTKIVVLPTAKPQNLEIKTRWIHHDIPSHVLL